MKLFRPRKEVYLDFASITPVDPRVMKEVARVTNKVYANPSSLHRGGVAAKAIMDASRHSVAEVLHAHADEIFFTGSGTEANNIAIQGVLLAPEARAYVAHTKSSTPAVSVKSNKPMHVLVSAIEHASVLEQVDELSKRLGSTIVVEQIPVHENGIVDLDSLKSLVRPETVLVSVMMVNNEIGTIQPINSVAKVVRDYRKSIGSVYYPFVHTDSCQAALYMDINLEKLGVDLLTLDSNKVYGPRGLGVLYKKRSVEIGKFIVPVLLGGGQEDGLRPSTENVPAIAGFAKAMAIARDERGSSEDKTGDGIATGEVVRLTKLRDYFIKTLIHRHTGTRVNGSHAPHERIANNVNVTFPNIDHEYFVLELDARGVACSTKSACLRDADTSYVITAIGNAEGQSVRFSLGRTTTKRDIDETLKIIDEIMLLHV